MLNPEQRTAVECNDKKILCLAGAGTGKTYTLIQRISRMVSNGISPSSILVLTFTNAAALEMKVRYKDAHKMQRCPEFRTFHAFCYSILSSDKDIRSELGYTRTPYIALDAVVKKASKEAMIQSGINLSDKLLSGIKVPTPKEKKDLEIYNKTLNRLLKKKNLITFDTLCYDICKLFVDDKDCIQKYKTRYKHIFVDEFQDTDPKQYEFVKSFKDADLFVVGDALQSLYGFRGADSSIIKNLASDKEWTTIKLHHNYRSTKAICTYANDMSIYAKDEFRIAIESDRFGEDVHTEHMTCKKYYVNDTDCLDKCTEAVKWPGTTAILCRTNSESNSIQNYFKKHELPFTMGNKADIAVNIIQSLQDENFEIEWFASLLSSDKYSNYIRKSFESNYSLDMFLSDFGYSNYLIKSYLGMIKEVKEKLKSEDNILYLWIDLFNIFNLKCPAMPDDIDTKEKLLSEIQYYLSGYKGTDASVYIGTVHSSKGLEYDNVILVGVGGASFPLTSEDNLNVYYVGITRAKSNLWVFKDRG